MGHSDWKGKHKTIFADNMILYIENPEESIKTKNPQNHQNLLEVINVSKTARYKTIHKNQLYFYTLAMKNLKLG